MVLKPAATLPVYQLMSFILFHYVNRIIIVVGGGKVYIRDIWGGGGDKLRGPQQTCVGARHRGIP